jgi:DNA-directed RNA polymerase specialized sigma24 family protein
MIPQAVALDGTTLASGAEDFAGGYERYLGRIHAYVAARVGSREQAEDLTSETFERALRSWRNAPARGPVDRWLFGIARRVVADHFRRQRPPRLSAISTRPRSSMPRPGRRSRSSAATSFAPRARF